MHTQDQTTHLWPVILSGWILCLVCFGFSGMTEAAKQPAQPPMTLQLEDHTRIEFTKTAVIRKGKTDAGEDTALWTIPVKEPQLPLLFEDSEKRSLLLYFTPKSDSYGELYAVQIENGQARWIHPIRTGNSGDKLTATLFLSPWIYLGRGIWLEQLDPDSGTIVNRYPARASILALKALNDETIEIQAEVQYTDHTLITLTFQQEAFHPHISGTQSLQGSLGLSRRVNYVIAGFVDGFLQLHQVLKDPVPEKDRAQWQDFDLRAAENAYRQAYQQDPVNPYFALFLALSLHYQGRPEEVEPLMQKSLAKSAAFWDESLRLGGICESVGWTTWADTFYEQGIAQYFKESLAPPEEIFLIDVLIHFPAQRWSANLYANGQIERALHVFEVRRSIFPYTEGDTLFSEKYAQWLRHKGEEKQADAEEHRIGNPAFWDNFGGLTPSGFLGFLCVASILLAVIVLRNDARTRKEFVIALIAGFLIGGVGISGMRPGVQAWVLLIIVAVYTTIIAITRRHRIVTVIASSYIVLLTGVFMAYRLGMSLSNSPIGGKVCELLFIAAFIGVRYGVRRRFEMTPVLRNLGLFLLIWVVLWGYVVWLEYVISIIGIEAALPIPSIDRGHPVWVAHTDKTVSEVRYPNRDLLITQAVVHHLSGDTEFARRVYEQHPEDPRALNNLGVMLLNDKPEEARSYFERAVKVDPNFAPASYNLEVVSGKRGFLEPIRPGDAWRITMYKKYAPGKLWISMPIIRTWSKAVYWSRGGCLVKGFADLFFSVSQTTFSIFSWVYILS